MVVAARAGLEVGVCSQMWVARRNFVQGIVARDLAPSFCRGMHKPMASKNQAEYRPKIISTRLTQMHRKNLGYNCILRIDQLPFSKKNEASVDITDTITCMEHLPETFCNFMRREDEGEAMQLQLH